MNDERINGIRLFDGDIEVAKVYVDWGESRSNVEIRFVCGTRPTEFVTRLTLRDDVAGELCAAIHNARRVIKNCELDNAYAAMERGEFSFTGPQEIDSADPTV